MQRIVTKILVFSMLLPGRLGLAMEEVVLYDCPKLAATPNLDGRSDDEVWKAVPAAELPYKFLEEVPTPAGSRSEFKAAFDDQCVYVTCTFYRDSDAPLKANHVGRDDPDLWTDDSAEIYFDPANDGHFYKFIVSNAGVVTDFHQTDAGIDYTWTASNGKVATSVTDKAWSLEMSVPWEDFGFKPEPGAVWGFEVLRFSGKNWASWTVGASYGHPEKFGYLCFGGGGFLTEFNRLLQVVRKSKGDQWQLVSPLGMLQFSSAAPSLEAALRQASQRFTEARFEAAVLADAKKRSELLEKLKPLEVMLAEARQAVSEGVNTARVQSLILKLCEMAAVARDLDYEARIAQALE